MEHTGATTEDGPKLTHPIQTNDVPPIRLKKLGFGEVLVQLGHITETQLGQALSAQRSVPSRERMPIGELCVKVGYISENTLRTVLKTCQKQILLSDLFLNMRLISVDQLHEAVKDQKVTKRKLGQILIEKGFIDRPHLNKALSIQLGIPIITPDPSLINIALFHSKNPQFFYKTRSVSISRNNKKGILTVVMDDPLDAATINDIEKAFGAAIQPAILGSGDIDSLLNDMLNVWDKYRGNDGHHT